jgi:hypothetical protein
MNWIAVVLAIAGANVGNDTLRAGFYANSDPLLHHIVSSVFSLGPYSSTSDTVSIQITAFGVRRKASPYIGTGDAKPVSDY